MSAFRQLARNHDFQRLWIGETVNELGTGLSLFALPLLTLTLTGSPLIAAGVEAGYLIGNAGALLPAGVLADLVDRRRVMLGCSTAGLVATGSLAVTIAAFHPTTVQLVASAFVAGTAAGCMTPAFNSAIRTVVSTEQLPTAMSQTQARHHIASLLGGPLAGLLYAAGRWLPFAADAFSFATSLAMVVGVRTDLSAPCGGADARTSRGHFVVPLIEGLQFIWGWAFFRVVLVWGALTNVLTYAVSFVIVISQVREGWPTWTIGLTSTAAGVGGLIGAALAPSIIERTRTGMLTIAISWASILPLTPLIWSIHPATVCACVFTLMLLNPAANAGLTAYRMTHTPTELQGRVMSAAQFSVVAIMPLGPILGGFLLTHIGRATAIVVVIGLAAMPALLVTLSRSVRQVPRPDAWQARPPQPTDTGGHCRSERSPD